MGESSSAIDPARGFDPEQATGLQVGLRVGLRRRDLVGADHDPEVGGHPGGLQGELDEGARRVGDQGERDALAAQLGDQLPRPDHRLDPVSQLGHHQLVELDHDLGGAAGLAEALLEDAGCGLRRCPDQLLLVLEGELEAAALEQILLAARPDRLGIEQQPVVVEDHRVRRQSRGGRHLPGPEGAHPRHQPLADHVVLAEGHLCLDPGPADAAEQDPQQDLAGARSR